MTNQVASSINIITRDRMDIIKCYPTMVDYQEEVYDYFDVDSDEYYYEDCIHELYVVYTKDQEMLVDNYYQKRKHGKKGTTFTFGYTKPIGEVADLTRSLSVFPKYSERNISDFLDLLHIDWLYAISVRPIFNRWLEKAREKIVAREAHPDRVRELLDSGTDLDDVGVIIDSKLADKLSW